MAFHGHLDYFQKPPLGGRPNTKPRDHGTRNAHNRWFILFLSCLKTAWIEIHWNNIWLRTGHIWLHTTLEGMWPHYMILEVSWDGLGTLSFGLSQFHGHGSWLVCEVALISVVFEPLYWTTYENGTSEIGPLTNDIDKKSGSSFCRPLSCGTKCKGPI
jgi:hypothetical protein